MLRYLYTDISEEEINMAFDHIDMSNEGRIDFDELNAYFSKVNGIPEHLSKPQNSQMNALTLGFFQQIANPGYVPHHHPQHPAMYNQIPPMYNQNPAMYNQIPQQQNSQGFNNFILDTLAQNLNGPAKSFPPNN